MITLLTPRAGIPIGEFYLPGGVKIDVNLNGEFRRFLEALVARSGGVVGPSVTDLDSLLQFDIREADCAELEKRVRDIEADAQPSPWAAIAEMGKKIADQDASIVDALMAELAELKKRVADLETSGAFR
jgi:hypothetical protein